jgi:hypothetical protein
VIRLSESVKCRKCGFENPPNAKFCNNCGARLNERLSFTAKAPKFEGLALLHVVGSAYLLISLLFNSLIQASTMFMISYLASGLLGLYTGYEFYKGYSRKYLKIISVLAVAIGLMSTLILFLIGLGVRGVIGPAWIIFATSLWTLWRERRNL